MVWLSKTYLVEIGSNNRPVCEFPARERLQSLLGRLGRVVLDEDFADTSRLATAHGGTGDLHGQDGAILLALFLHVFADLCLGAG
jgi:hypothetical protein